MDATLDSNVACADEDFSKLKVHDLKRYLKERGIQLSDGGKGKRKAELVDLCEKAAAMKQAKLDDTAEDRNKLMEDKLRTNDGKLPDPKTLTAWTNNFSNIPEFTFGDLYNYLVGKEDYSEENLRSFKSLLGFKLFRDGHVIDLKYCPLEKNNFCFFKFKVKPTERAKSGRWTGYLQWFHNSKIQRRVAIHFLPKPEDPDTPEPLVKEHITNDANVERFETVENVTVYTMKEYANIFFKCQNNIDNNMDISEDIVESFMKFLSVSESQCDVICSKTVHQGSSQLWFDQRSGRITASNFYRCAT
ncbi:unnamed protein product [Porites lobata]|uniref:SAP domain-containing protein n=1 Tax=Porites lobata TaxID=104759 RepID=A0ABN8NNL1_9CNID|nr:unnamed protein product [Porites lobata]